MFGSDRRSPAGVVDRQQAPRAAAVPLRRPMHPGPAVHVVLVDATAVPAIPGVVLLLPAAEPATLIAD